MSSRAGSLSSLTQRAQGSGFGRHPLQHQPTRRIPTAPRSPQFLVLCLGTDFPRSRGARLVQPLVPGQRRGWADGCSHLCSLPPPQPWRRGSSCTFTSNSSKPADPTGPRSPCQSSCQRHLRSLSRNSDASVLPTVRAPVTRRFSFVKVFSSSAELNSCIIFLLIMYVLERGRE